jgi:Domain of unknown function (DUF5753)
VVGWSTWAKVTGSDVDALLALHHRAQHEFETFRDAYPAEGGSAAHQATYAAAEQAATTLFCYQPLIVHALLQTPEYARVVLNLPGGPVDHGATPDEVDRMIAERMRRASIIYEPCRTVTVLVGEAALRNAVGSPSYSTRPSTSPASRPASPTPASLSFRSADARSFRYMAGNNATTSSASKPPPAISKSLIPTRLPNTVTEPTSLPTPQSAKTSRTWSRQPQRPLAASRLRTRGGGSAECQSPVANRQSRTINRGDVCAQPQ